MARSKQRVLWFDDNESFSTRAGSMLEKSGYAVEYAASWDVALKCIFETQFDVLLVDWKLGENRTGIDFFKFLDSENLQTQAKWCLVSYHFDGGIPDLAVPQNVRPIPFENDWLKSRSEFKEFVKRIQGSDDPMELSFHAYSALTIEGRSKFSDDVQSEYESSIRNELRSHYWILACGPEFDVVKRADSFGEVLVDDEVWQLAGEIGYAPFQVFADEYIDDCAGGGGELVSYPSLTLQLDGIASGAELQIHFDTGSSTTFVDAEAMNNPGNAVARQTLRTGAGRVHDLNMTVVKLTGGVKCQATGQSTSVEFRAKAVQQWKETSLARKCVNERCPLPTDSGICKYRSGLIGQNFLVETRKQVVLVPEDKIIITRVL